MWTDTVKFAGKLSKMGELRTGKMFCYSGKEIDCGWGRAAVCLGYKLNKNWGLVIFKVRCDGVYLVYSPRMRG